MPTAEVRKDEEYCAGDAERATVTVTIGQLQAGGGAYKWQGQTEELPDNDRFEVQKAGGLAGNALTVLLHVVDVRPETNKTSVKLVVESDHCTKTYKYNYDVPAEFDSVDYWINLKIVEDIGDDS